MALTKRTWYPKYIKISKSTLSFIATLLQKTYRVRTYWELFFTKDPQMLLLPICAIKQCSVVGATFGFTQIFFLESG